MKRTLIEAIRSIASKQLSDTVYLVDMNVDRVDKQNMTCDGTPIGGDATTQLSGVLLMTENSDGLVVFPAVGSTVKVVFSTRTVPFVVQFSDIEEIEFYIDNGDGNNPTKFNFKSGLQQFNDGTFGGLAKTEALKDKLNALENLVNSILNVLKTTTIPLAPSGTYPFAPLYAALNDITPITTQASISNDLIKHGE